MTPSCTADVHTGDTRRRPAALYLFEFNRSCRLAERLVDWQTVTVVCLLPAAHVCCKATSRNTAGAAFTYSTQPSVFARSCSSNIPVQIPSRCDSTGLSCFPPTVADSEQQARETGLKQKKSPRVFAFKRERASPKHVLSQNFFMFCSKSTGGTIAIQRLVRKLASLCDQVKFMKCAKRSAVLQISMAPKHAPHHRYKPGKCFLSFTLKKIIK